MNYQSMTAIPRAKFVWGGRGEVKGGGYVPNRGIDERPVCGQTALGERLEEGTSY